MTRFFKNENGGVLPLVLMVFVVLFILGVSLLQIGMSETVQSTWQGNRVQAHYLARSGVEIGDELLQTTLLTYPQTGTLGDLVVLLNASVSPSYTVDGVGEFTIAYSLTPLDEIKITAVGTTTMANPSASRTVTFTKALTKGASFENAASQWFHTNGFSLSAGVFPDDPPQPNAASFLGKIAYLGNETKTIQNPSVGSPAVMSNFRASIINFGEHDGISIDSSSNSYASFDSEIIFFNGRVDTKNNSYLEMLLSDAVLNQKTSDMYDANYPNPAGTSPGGLWTLDFMEYDNIVSGVQVLEGFESDDRYLEFTGHFTSSPTTVYRPNSSAFEPDVKYGIVRIPQVNVGNTIDFVGTGKGYYYFPNGTRLDKAVSTVDYYGRDMMIHISDDDPLTSILDNLFKWNYGSSQGIWNYQ